MIAEKTFLLTLGAPDDKTRLDIKSINITPNPPQKGQKVTVDIELNLSK